MSSVINEGGPRGERHQRNQRDRAERAEPSVVAWYAAESAQAVLAIFERAHPVDSRPRDAINAAWTFARGGARGKALRDTAWAALKSTRDVDTAGMAAAGDAARAAMCAASAPYLHPLTDAQQVKHILEAGAHAARAAELIAGDDRAVGADTLRTHVGTTLSSWT